MLTLDIFNRLEDFREIFDIERYKKDRYAYKCSTVLHRNDDIFANDNYQLAKKMNYPMPSYLEAWLYLSPKIIKRSIKNLGKRLLKRSPNKR